MWYIDNCISHVWSFLQQPINSENVIFYVSSQGSDLDEHWAHDYRTYYSPVSDSKWWIC